MAKKETKTESQSYYDKKIDLLEDQLHSINVKINKPERKSWLFKNSSLLISLFALLTSIVFSIRGIYKEEEKEKLTERSQKIQKIEALTLKLTELAERNYKLAAENPNVNTTALSVLYNYQRLIYLNQVIDLLDDSDQNFPPDIYALIGNELKNEGDFQRAKKYYHLEYKNAQTPTSKVVANRDLGAIYGTPENTFFNLDSSRFYWNISIEESKNIEGEKGIDYKGYSYQLWAGLEFYSGNTEFAKSLVDSARNIYQKLNDSYPNKQIYLSQLKQMVQYENNKNISKSFFNLAGEWKIVNSSDIKGYVYFSQNVNGWFCSVETFENEQLSLSASGAMITVTDSHLAFSLNGVKKMLLQYGDRIAFNGSSKIYPDNNNNDILYARMYELNGKEQRFTLYKQ